MALETFFQEYNAFLTQYESARLLGEDYRQQLVKAQSEPVCTTSFGITLQQLTSADNSWTMASSQTVEQAKIVRDSYVDLTTSEQNNSGVQTAMTDVTQRVNLITRTRAFFENFNPSLATLQEQYNSCTTLKEPTTPTVTEQALTQQTGQNKVPDDQKKTVNISPQNPNQQGQKANTNTTNPTGENTNIISELLTPNPLASFASSTYNLTLYMVTPEAYNVWLENNVMPREGAYIVAKSGGFSKSDPRALPLGGSLNGADAATGPGYDYFIDDLRINSVYPTKSNMQSSVVVQDLSFKIYEPHGFGFLQRVARASAEVTKLSPKLSSPGKQPPMPFQMLYMLEIKFTGYDANGAVLPSAIPKGPDKLVDNLQRIFPLAVANVKTKLDGRVTVYEWQANVPNERLGLGQIYGKLNSKISYEARTVGEAIGSFAGKNRNSLLGALNEEQRSLKESKRQQFVTTYDVVYEDARISSAELIDDKDIYKPSSAMAGATRVEEVNPKTANKAVTWNINTKSGEIPQGMSIVNVIDQLIYRSTYVTDSLNKVNNQKIETGSTDKPSKLELEWFVVLPKVKIAEWDDQKNYWAVNVTYQIKRYKIPFIRTQYANKKSLYYGPLKRYYYWFTGQNTEIINYEQTYDSLYYILQPYSVSPDAAAAGRGEGRVTVQPDSGGGGGGPLGKANGGSKINDSVKYSLYSPGDLATATINVLGDPDYLMETIGGSLDFARSSGSSSYLFYQFYNKRGSINPYGGQIYIEIVFKTAEDYNKQTGLMEFNPNLIFYGNQEQETKIIGSQGIVYLITHVESVMRRGQFTQQLNLVIVPPDQLVVRPGQTVGAVPDNGRQNPQPPANARYPGTPVSAGIGIDGRQQSWSQDELYRLQQLNNLFSSQASPSTNTTPLAQSAVVTPSASGRSTVNDDASVNNRNTVRLTERWPRLGP